MKRLAHFIAGIMLGAALFPVVTFAARTAAPVLTGLFSSTTLSVNLPAPVATFPQASTGGSVSSSSTMYFEVTALDGVGETVPSPIMGTTTKANSLGFNITWPPIPGATSYRIYFSTSTPQALTQYFTATTTGAYDFTSTTSPTYIPTGQPQANTAYVHNLVANGNSWLNGGAVAIGTTTFPTNILFQIATTTATTTELIGAKGSSGGHLIIVDTSSGHTTCTELTTAAGAGTFKAITCP